MGGWRDRISDLVLGAPENQKAEDLDRAVRRGSPAHKIRALRQMGARPGLGDHGCFVSGLSDPIPGVRRAAAWALGQRAESQSGERLCAATTAERCDHVRLSMGVAAVRCGAEVSEIWAVLRSGAERTLYTWYGPRQPATVIGVGTGDLTLLWSSSLTASGASADTLNPEATSLLRERLLTQCRADRDDRQALLDLAAQQHPDDWQLIHDRMTHQGRRMRHVVTEALGIHGDPRSIPALLSTLRAVDVDPGHGFAGRARAATALGRIGVPRVARALVQALEDEALDHEGRPGAGLGVQNPVRALIIAALGEIGADGQADRLASYLADTSGTARGGFYLPAMDALWKLDAAHAVRPLLVGSELVVANALGVLRATGRDADVSEWKDDPRPRVAAVARAEG